MPQIAIGAIVSLVVGQVTRGLTTLFTPSSAKPLDSARRDLDAGSAPPPDPLSVSPEPGGACIGMAGFRRVGGRLVWKGKSAVDNKTYLVIALCSLRVDEIVAIYVNDVSVARTGETVTTAPWTSASMKIKTYDGSQTTVDSAMQTAFPGWNSQYVGLRTAYARIILDPSVGGNPFSKGDPDFTFAVRAMRFYDPRDATQSATNSATWKYTNNPALVAAGYLMSELGKNVPAADIDWTTVTTAANTCDESVTTLDGSEARYGCALVWKTDERHEDVLARIGAAMAGGAFFIGDKWRVYAGSYDDSTAETITPATYAGGGLAWSDYRPIAEIVNGVRGKFSSAPNAYEPRDFPSYQDAAAVIADGSEFWLDLDLSAVVSPSQAQRIARIAYNKKRYGFPANVETQFNHFDVVANDVVKITDDLAGFTAKTFRVSRETLATDYSIRFELEYEDATFYAWTAATDEKAYNPEPPLSGNDSSSGTGYTATRDTTTVPVAGGVAVDTDAGGSVVPNVTVWVETGHTATGRVSYLKNGPSAKNFDYSQSRTSGQTTQNTDTMPSGGELSYVSLTVKAKRTSDNVESASQTLYDANGVAASTTQAAISGDLEATGENYKLPATVAPSVTAADATTITVNCPQIASTSRADSLQLLVNTTNNPSTATVVGTQFNAGGGADFSYVKPGAGQIRYFWARGRTSGEVNGPTSPVLTVEFT